MSVSVPEAKAALERVLAQEAGARRVEIKNIVALAGGTVNENWRLDVDIMGGPQAHTGVLVLRADRPISVVGSLPRSQEYAVMQAAYDAGVTLPEPLWVSGSDGPLGREFFIMRWVGGTASAARIVRDGSLGGPHELLAERLGEELARLQTVTPDSRKLPFLPVPPDGVGRAGVVISNTRNYLDTLPSAHPEIEWGLRWLELNKPPSDDLVLTHGDFRTGNYLVDDSGLTGILDWELGSWGDPLEDIGWFFMKTWRYGAIDAVAGGIASREVFLRSYERASGRRVDPATMHYWEILANVKWAAVSIQQGERHVSGKDKSLELCLTGRKTAEMEYEALRLIAETEG